MNKNCFTFNKTQKKNVSGTIYSIKKVFHLRYLFYNYFGYEFDDWYF